jgi:hypothetical protein
MGRVNSAHEHVIYHEFFEKNLLVFISLLSRIAYYFIRAIFSGIIITFTRDVRD